MQYQIQTERQRIWAEFNQLRRILDSEEQRELQKLEEEEKRILDTLAEAEAELAQQTQLVKDLISDLEHRCKWSAVDLLQVGGMPQSGVLEIQSKLPSFLCPWALIFMFSQRFLWLCGTLLCHPFTISWTIEYKHCRGVSYFII